MTSVPTSRNPSVFRVAGNAVSLLLADIVARLASVVLTMAMVRQLSTSDYGTYSAILGFLAVGGLVAEFGLSLILVREIAQQRSRSAELLSGAVLIVAPLVVISSAGIVAAAIAFGYSPAFCALLGLASMAIAANTAVLLAGAVLRAFERMGVLSLINSSLVICSTVAGIVWLQHGAGLRELIVLQVAAPATTALFLLAYVSRYLGGFAFTQGLRVVGSLLLGATPLAILGLCEVTLRRFSILWLSGSRGMSDTGIYSAAVVFVEAMTMIITSITGAAFPSVAIRWKESAVAMMHSYEQILRFFVLVGAAITTGVFLLADKMVLLLYNERYLQSAICLRILVWSFLLNAFSGPVAMLLIVTKARLSRFIPYALVITALNVALHIWLTSRYGYMAASWITVFTSLLLFGSKLLVLRDILPMRPRWLLIGWRSVVAAVLMGGILWWIHDQSLFVLVIIGFFIYFIILVALGEFNREFRMVLQYLRTIKT